MSKLIKRAFYGNTDCCCLAGMRTGFHDSICGTCSYRLKNKTDYNWSKFLGD